MYQRRDLSENGSDHRPPRKKTKSKNHSRHKKAQRIARKLASPPKSSVDARRLLEKARRVPGQKRPRSWQQVSVMCGLPNRAVAWKMAYGLLADTPEMRALVRKAKERARRAYYSVLKASRNPLNESAIDLEVAQRKADSALRELKELRALLSLRDPKNSQGEPCQE
jgi:hypothetical protein